jgi:hypothetical protein
VGAWAGGAGPFRSALRIGQQRPHLEEDIPDRKLRQLKAAVVDAETVVRQVSQSSMDSLDLMELNRQLDQPGVKYQNIYIELSDIVELVSLALRRFRQQHYLDSRDGGRGVITARLSLDSPAQQDTEEDASSS